MKAEHRKELHTNALADRMGKLLKGMRSRTQSTSLMVWVIILLAVGTLGAWWYFSTSARRARSALWVGLDDTGEARSDDRYLENLEQFAKANPGTVPARVARFQIARTNLRDGLQRL